MKDIKIHCSSLGKIMGKRGLGKTGQSHIDELLKKRLYKKRKEFSSKYTDKGSEQEDSAIEMINEALGYADLEKNKDFFSNEFIQGTPDLITKDLIIDIKCPWDCFTFPRFDKELPNSDYYWQLQGYMWLTGKESAQLIYCLMDTPLFLIERESSYFCRNNPGANYEDVFSKNKTNMTYDDVDIVNKIKVFEVKRNEKDIELMKDRILEAREYANKLIK